MNGKNWVPPDRRVPWAATAQSVLRLPRPLPGTDKDEEVTQRFLAERRAELADALAVCESPIESLFARALLASGDGTGAFLRLCFPGSRRRVYPLARGRGGALYAQFPLDLDGAPIRIDFAIVGAERLAIEIDGYDHHHRTRAQIARDNARDRELTALGWKPIRFSGSEVYREPQERADDVFRLLGLSPGVAPPPLVAKAAPRPRPEDSLVVEGMTPKDVAEAIRAAEGRGDIDEAMRLLGIAGELARQRRDACTARARGER